MVRGGGKKKIEVANEQVCVRLPAGLYEDLLRVMAAEKRWFDRQDFVKEAVREKIERHRRPGVHPAAAQAAASMRVT
ncbi:MAG: ribbon-helix-helix domain-containing protein [Thermoplasmata archaeon]|nr:ribbon-helix-helix domain-containing protein [Thermoplasmata archaeon]